MFALLTRYTFVIIFRPSGKLGTVSLTVKLGLYICADEYVYVCGMACNVQFANTYIETSE